jgi:hypothetical protein
MSRTTELTRIIDQKFGSSLPQKPTSLGDWLHAVGKASEALLYSILFMPELIEVGGSILLAWGVPDEASKKRFLDALGEGSKSREELEASFNFIEVGYLFDAPGRDTSDEEDVLLAELIRDAWNGWLNTSYPDRRFMVEVLPEDVTGSTVGVHFFEIR